MGTPAVTGAVEVVLLDIEGTTTPVDFVYGTLFPFARERVLGFLEERGREDGVREDVARLRQEHAAGAGGAPPWEDSAAGIAAYVRWLMDGDRKSTGLKALQGRIWQEGFEAGRLRGQVYPDVAPALARWRAQGRRAAVFSSGSVLAQKLLFASTPAGDLTRFLDAHFDTTTGPKAAPQSYARIAEALGTAPGAVLFLSDVVAELDAARQAGMATGLAVRGEAPAGGGGHPLVRSFDEVLPEPR
jgi:enolase-phosphatase E1